MNSVKILFLAANPANTIQLRLDEEIRSISEKIRAAEHRDLIDLVSAWAVRPDDLLQLLNVHKPHIVHFSGHGSTSGEIILLNHNGNLKQVSVEAIKALFAALKDNTSVVVLNACYSRQQAEAITEVIDCAIGMNDAIGDHAAIVFVASFYRAIGFGRSVQQAFDQGKTALLLEGIPENATPELLTKTGVDPSELFLITDSEVDKSKNDTVNKTLVVSPSPDESTWPFTNSEFGLRVTSGGRTQLFELNRIRMTVGRASVADIRLPNEPACSRQHFSITWHPKNRTHILEDWGHPNSIALNGNWVKSRSNTELKVGDEIRLGNSILRYEKLQVEKSQVP